MMNEDWSLVLSFFPHDWRELAKETNALKGLRKAKSPEDILRTMFIHFACGYSLRETAVRAQKAQLAEISDVALLKRLRKSKDWLYHLCVSLFKERGICTEESGSPQFRIFDATNVKEPGKTGSLWRIHYSIKVPSLECDFFKLTGTSGKNTGEDFSQFPIQKGDYIIADRGYSRAKGIHYVASREAFLCVRLNQQITVLNDSSGKRFALGKKLAKLGAPGEVGKWPVFIPLANKEIIPARLCALRKSEEATRRSIEKLKRRASRKGNELKPETLEFAKYVLLLTNFPENKFDTFDVLEWYRVRWQIELVFKRFKQIAQLGHLPKHDDESAKAWLYGKLLAALLTEKIIDHAVSISPWGYPLLRTSH